MCPIIRICRNFYAQQICSYLIIHHVYGIIHSFIDLVFYLYKICLIIRTNKISILRLNRGGAIAKTMHSLINNIETFDLEDFTYKMRKHHNNLESNEGGTATHKKLIISFMKKSSTDKS